MSADVTRAPERRAAAARGPGVLAGLLGLMVLGGCSDDPVAPAVELLIRPAGPTVLFALPSGRAPEALAVSVVEAVGEEPAEGVRVRWSVVTGDGASLDRSTTVTDSLGLAAVGATVGASPGEARVRAELVEDPERFVEFELWAVDAPELTGVPASVAPGETATLAGANFSPVAEHDVVLFSGVPARVLEARRDELLVRVPGCLPAGPSEVTVSLGSATSAARTTEVEVGGPVEDVPVGGVVDLAASDPFDCRRLPAGDTWLAAIHSAAVRAGARWTVWYRFLTGEAVVSLAHASGDRGDPWPSGGARDLQGAFDVALRLREGGLLAESGAGVRPRPAPSRPAPVPAVGEVRTFSVQDGSGGFDEVRAVARRVGERAVLYVDEEAAGSLPGAALDALSDEFDELIHPTVTAAFGELSDLDGNERVAILHTPAVNRLTPRGSADGFVGGFFFGLDLLEGRSGSNEGEVFYTLVPDPDGRYGDPRPLDLVLKTLPAILAHELQHMIHFNERVVQGGARSSDAVWLAEGLAQMAEDLVAEAARERGRPDLAEDYRAGNVTRGQLYLHESPDISLVMSGGGGGTLEERGAAWLFVRYLYEHFGGTELLRRLTRSALTGTQNVAAATGTPWPELLADWSVAVYAGDEPGLEGPGADPRLAYPETDLRELLAVKGGYPLAPPVVSATGDDVGGTSALRSAATRHLLVRPPADRPLTVAVAGAGGDAAPPEAEVVLRMVRLR